MLIHLGMLLAGLVALVLSGDWLVRGAVATALRLGVSRFLASIVIVGFGTSAPEMLVAIDSTVKGAPGLALGNLIGSNIVNILLVLGLPALFLTIHTKGRGLLRSVFVTGLATIAWLAITPFYGLTPTIGMIFLGVLIVYILSALFIPGAASEDDLEEEGDASGWLSIGIFLALLAEAGLLISRYMNTGSLTISDSFAFALVLASFILMLVIPGEDEMKTRDGQSKNEGWSLITALICLGVIGLPLGSHFTISGAKGLAEYYEWPTELVGLTVVAIGTSLPELAAALAATLRRENDMILGNVAGSNLFNLLGAGGLVAIVPLFTGSNSIDMPSLFLKYDHWVMGGTFAAFFLYVLLRKSIGKLSGVIFLAGYAAYLAGIYYFHNLGQDWPDLWSLINSVAAG